MRNLICFIVVIILSLSSGACAQEHTFSWGLTDAEDRHLVTAWEFNGTKYADTEEGLRELIKVSIKPRDVIRIKMPVRGPKESASLFPVEGCILAVMLQYWNKKHAKFELYRGEERLNTVFISWRSEGGYESLKNAVYQLDGEDIGDFEAARKIYSSIEVKKGTLVVFLNRDIIDNAREPFIPEPFPAPYSEWVLKDGAIMTKIPDFGWPERSVRLVFRGSAFPGEEEAAPKKPVLPADQKPENKSIQPGQKGEQ